MARGKSVCHNIIIIGLSQKASKSRFARALLHQGRGFIHQLREIIDRPYRHRPKIKNRPHWQIPSLPHRARAEALRPRHHAPEALPSRSSSQVRAHLWQKEAQTAAALDLHGIKFKVRQSDCLTADKITAQDEGITFAHARKNGVWHCQEPLSSDLSSAESIRKKPASSSAASSASKTPPSPSSSTSSKASRRTAPCAPPMKRPSASSASSPSKTSSSPEPPPPNSPPASPGRWMRMRYS